MDLLKFDQFLNEAKSDKKTDEMNDKFNEMLNDVKKKFMEDPLKVVKAFGYSANDLFIGKFVCSQELEWTNPKKLEKIHNTLCK